MNKTSILKIILVLLFLLNNRAVCASNEILLKARHFTPSKGVTAATKAKIEAVGKKAHVLVQLERIPTSKQKKGLEAKGIKLLAYIPNKAWFASIASDKVSEIAALSDVRAISEILPEDKIDHSIKEKGVNAYSTNEEGEAKLTVLFFADVPLADAYRVISRFGGTVKGDAPIINAVVAYLPKDQIYELAGHDYVKWIDQHYEPALTNDTSRAAINVNALQAAPYNLTGTNVQIGEWDGGCVDPFEEHDDLEGRVIHRDCGGGESDHATHVAGTMIGDGSLSATKGGTALQWRGMATEATVISYKSWDDVDEFEVDYDDAIREYGIELSQNSWGFLDWDGEYDAYAEAEDKAVRGKIAGKRIPIIFSAGNEGESGWTSIRSNAVAKNVITVGATYSDLDEVTCFSSLGPAADGRIKPDVMAPGDKTPCSDDYGIKSTVAAGAGYYSDYKWSGTSMASPAVSGTIALMFRDWWNNHYGITLLPSTIKAILIHTAEDINNTGPDFSSGYGRIDAKAAIDLIRYDVDSDVIVQEKIIDADDVNDRDRFTIDVPEGKSELKITLVWDDYPGEPAASKALVNDLDLIVKNPAGTRFYPWTLDPENPENPAVRTQADSLNNIEQVYVSNPSPGIWTIDVNGPNVPKPEQKYSLVSSDLPFTPVYAVINPIQCYNSTEWMACPDIGYGSSITQVRANCTDPDGYLTNVRFKLECVTDSNVIFDSNATSNNGDWWVYDNSDIAIDDFKEWKLTVTCLDNEGITTTAYESWTVPNSRFMVLNSSDEAVGWFDNAGHLFLEGTLTKDKKPNATGNNEFRFQDPNGTDVAIINMTNGNMYITGELFEEQSSLTPLSGEDDFIIKNSSGNTVGYIDESGNVYLKGKLYEEEDL